MFFKIRDYLQRSDCPKMEESPNSYYINSSYITCINIPDKGEYAKLGLRGSRDLYFNITKTRAIEIIEMLEQEKQQESNN